MDILIGIASIVHLTASREDDSREADVNAGPGITQVDRPPAADRERVDPRLEVVGDRRTMVSTTTLW